MRGKILRRNGCQELALWRSIHSATWSVSGTRVTLGLLAVTHSDADWAKRQSAAAERRRWRTRLQQPADQASSSEHHVCCLLCKVMEVANHGYTIMKVSYTSERTYLKLNKKWEIHELSRMRISYLMKTFLVNEIDWH